MNTGKWHMCQEENMQLQSKASKLSKVVGRLCPSLSAFLLVDPISEFWSITKYVLSEGVSTLGWLTVKELKSGNCLLIIHLPAVLSQESEWYNFPIHHLQCPSVFPSTGSEKTSISIPGGCQCWREAEKRKASRWRAAITAETGFVTTRGSHHCIVLDSLTVSYHLCLFKRERERDRKRDKWRGRDRESI